MKRSPPRLTELRGHSSTFNFVFVSLSLTSLCHTSHHMQILNIILGWKTENGGNVNEWQKTREKEEVLRRVGRQSRWTSQIRQLLLPGKMWGLARGKVSTKNRRFPQHPILISNHNLFTWRKDCLLRCFKAKFHLNDNKSAVIYIWNEIRGIFWNTSRNKNKGSVAGNFFFTNQWGKVPKTINVTQLWNKWS